jgi:hypothetical protein
MKKLLYLYLLLLFIVPFANAQVSDEGSIKQVITASYIEGIQNEGSSEQIRKGFHPSFNMLRMTDNDIKPLPIEEWISNIEKTKAQNPNAPAKPKAEGKFINVDITGNAAVVKLELYRQNKKTFTDYLVLYKFPDGWKIVSKTYFRHP